MQFIDHILIEENIRNKPSCFAECGLKSCCEIPIVGVPEPRGDRFLGVLISSDPTTAFIEPYTEARTLGPEGWRQRLMTAKAPPQWLLEKISTFDRKYLERKNVADIERLKKVMVCNVYWTHLHKCSTEKRGVKAQRFSLKNARLCGDRWLRQELDDAVGQGAKFVICVGNNVKAWMSDREIEKSRSGLQVFYFPHPASTANGAWNPRDDEHMKYLKKNIIGLLTAIS